MADYLMDDSEGYGIRAEGIAIRLQEAKGDYPGKIKDHDQFN